MIYIIKYIELKKSIKQMKGNKNERDILTIELRIYFQKTLDRIC